MRVLVEIWRRFKNFIVFLLLEIIAITLILSLNVYQNSFLHQTTTSIRGSFVSVFTSVNEYLNLAKENKSLIEENRKLTELLRNKAFSAYDSTLLTHKKYSYVSAKVSYASIGLPDNYLILSKGQRQGVKPEMAVCSPSGLVGIVYAVTQDYASVLPLINTSFSCLVSISETTLSANTSWDGKDYRYVKVTGVPLHLSIQKGDSVFTNKNSTLYPNKELIGTVEGITKEDLGKSFSLKVKLATDFSNLHNVYVIENNDKTQIDSLLNNE